MSSELLTIKITISELIMNWLSKGEDLAQNSISLASIISKEHNITVGQARFLINEVTTALIQTMYGHIA